VDTYDRSLIPLKSFANSNGKTALLTAQIVLGHAKIEGAVRFLDVMGEMRAVTMKPLGLHASHRLVHFPTTKFRGCLS
jgi:hypothetical protein